MKIQLCNKKGVSIGHFHISSEDTPQIIEHNKRLFVRMRCEAYQYVYYETDQSVYRLSGTLIADGACDYGVCKS